jgi:ATP-dependent protease HslVU (ClpYQ) peptidase subunit
MTCIVGLVHDGKVYMGGDSAGVAGYDLTVRADEKVFTNGEFIMGFTSSFRMGQLLRYKFKPPYHMPGVPTDEYMVTSFVDEVRKCLREGGYARNNNGEESGGTFLVGYKGELFVIHDDYQVAKVVDGFAAVGCGYQVARGALFATSPGLLPEDRVKKALEAAERFSAGVRGPFVIKSL